MTNISRRAFFGLLGAATVCAAIPAEAMTIHEKCITEFKKLSESYKTQFPVGLESGWWNNPETLKKVKEFNNEFDDLFAMALECDIRESYDTYSDEEWAECKQILNTSPKVRDEVWNTPQTLSNTGFVVAIMKMAMYDFKMPIDPMYSKGFKSFDRRYGQFVMSRKHA